MNYLPLKLEKLRKHYNYSQSYLAECLGIEVIDYMGLENGRSMINYEQAKKLASLYHVELIEIFKNAVDVTLYDIDEAKTDEINIEYFIPKKTILQRIKSHPMLLGLVLGLLTAFIIIGLIRTSQNNKPYEVVFDNSDRLSASSTSIVYIDNSGAVKGSGDNANGQISNLPSSNAIKVIEGSDFTLALLKDGTLQAFGLIESYQKEISKLKNITDIAAGDNHIVALDNVGRVYCIGDNSNGQCDIDNKRNIEKVFATANGSIAIDSDGEIHIAGEFVGTSKLKKCENVIDVASSPENLIILNKDGTCYYVAEHNNSLYSVIDSWNNIIEVECGDEFFAGLKKDGTIVLAALSLNESVVASWNNIIAIASGNDYLVAYDGETIYGTGKNSYNQFNDSKNYQTLSKVTNITHDIKDGYLEINFDKVVNASEYEVALVLDNVEQLVKTVKTNETVYFEESTLKDNTMYTVNIRALGKGIYEDSVVNSITFTYLKEVEEEKEETITIKDDLIGMNKETFENYLKGLDVASKTAKESSNLCSNNKQVIEEISGIREGSTYSLSELKSREVTYTYCKINEGSNENEPSVEG